MVECVIRTSGNSGVSVCNNGKAVLQGGTISENKEYGVDASFGGKVTVANAEKGKPQTVSKENGNHDWATMNEGSEIIGIPHEKIVREEW